MSLSYEPLKQPLVLTRVWRAELLRVGIFFISIGIAPILTGLFPGSLITGKIFRVGTVEYWLSLPLFWLIPAALLLNVVVRIYNAVYTIDEEGVQARDGILSLRQSITRFRHEDIRSIEAEQTILDRMLNVGNIEIGTAATEGVEAVLRGVNAPKDIQVLLQGIREGKLKINNVRSASAASSVSAQAV